MPIIYNSENIYTNEKLLPRGEDKRPRLFSNNSIPERLKLFNENGDFEKDLIHKTWRQTLRINASLKMTIVVSGLKRAELWDCGSVSYLTSIDKLQVTIEPFFQELDSVGKISSIIWTLSRPIYIYATYLKTLGTPAEKLLATIPAGTYTGKKYLNSNSPLSSAVTPGLGIEVRGGNQNIKMTDKRVTGETDYLGTVSLYKNSSCALWSFGSREEGNYTGYATGSLWAASSCTFLGDINYY